MGQGEREWVKSVRGRRAGAEGDGRLGGQGSRGREGDRANREWKAKRGCCSCFRICRCGGGRRSLCPRIYVCSKCLDSRMWIVAAASAAAALSGERKEGRSEGGREEGKAGKQAELQMDGRPGGRADPSEMTARPTARPTERASERAHPHEEAVVVCVRHGAYCLRAFRDRILLAPSPPRQVQG